MICTIAGKQHDIPAGLIYALKIITTVRLKIKQIQLVGCHPTAHLVIAARKRLLQGHFLEQGDRQYL